MADFLAEYTRDLLAHAPYMPTQSRSSAPGPSASLIGFSAPSTSRFAMRSLTTVSTSEALAGTRGIVLLLCFIWLLDDADDRLCLSTEPEENLDPKSVFDETGLAIHRR